MNPKRVLIATAIGVLCGIFCAYGTCLEISGAIWNAGVGILKNIEREKGFFTVNSVKDELNVSMESVRNFVMKRDKLIDMFEEGKIPKWF